MTLLPRVAKFWLKYTYMEEIMGEIAKARSVFERWMDWKPDEQAWMAFIKFEERRGHSVQAPRNVFMRYVDCTMSQRSFLKWAQWEEKGSHLAEARGVYERSLSELDDEEMTEKLFINFAQFEERCREPARARVIYQFAIKQLPREVAPELYRHYISFEKKHGTTEGIDEIVTEKRRKQYNEVVAAKPMNYDYDGWFDLIQLEESQTALPGEMESTRLDRIREVYERAVANVPPILEKRYWGHYIYLWISYAIFEELDAKDPDRARRVLETCLEIIPHKQFTFAKVWLHLAKLEIRCGNLTAARLVMGRAIGTSPKKKIFDGYIEFELQVGEVDRCRKIYTKYLEWAPESCEAWSSFAKLERDVGEDERTRALYELAIGQEEIDMPEVMWKVYIDFETEQGETDRARALYKRLLEKTQHVKVWITYGGFEADCGDEKAMRAVFRRGYDSLKGQGLKEERVLLLDTWRAREKDFGDDGVKLVDAMMPRRFKKKRMVTDETGAEVAWEELYDYVFPDETDKPSNLKILEMAQKWKSSQANKV